MLWFSAIGKLLIAAKSTFHPDGPINELRPALPNVPGAAGANAAVLNHFWMVLSSCDRFGLVPVAFRRLDSGTTTCPAAFQPIGLRGRPLCRVKIPPTSQPPATAYSAAFFIPTCFPLP